MQVTTGSHPGPPHRATVLASLSEFPKQQVDKWREAFALASETATQARSPGLMGGWAPHERAKSVRLQAGGACLEVTALSAEPPDRIWAESSRPAFEKSS